MNLDISEYENRFHVENGVVRWNSNNSVPPEDCLVEMVNFGLVTYDQYEASKVVREKELDEFLTNYRKQMETYEPSDEERFEMRAAFGPDATVVNILTGKSFKL